MRPFFSALITGLALPVFLSAQSTLPATESIFGILQQYDPLEVSIETNIKELKENKDDEQWQPGVFRIFKGDSVAVQYNVQVAARGIARKKICDFPPVKIRFYDQKPENDSLADINELKLVVSCKNTNLDEEWVQKEYLVYELYNIVSDQSFRVKPATVKFGNPQKRGGGLKSFCFFIESEKELAARLNALPVKSKVLNSKNLDTAAYDRMCLFQYMVGNTDWSVRGRHNIKILYLLPYGPNIPVPYDFDYAGVVATEYAVPNNKLPIQNVQERFYMGRCRDAAYYRELFNLFLSKKKALFQHCENANVLPKGARKEMAGYLEEFFDILENPRLAQKEILENCDKVK